MLFPSDVYPALSDQYTVRQLDEAMTLYQGGMSCARCEAVTGVNAEMLREMLGRAGLIRSHSEAQAVRYRRKRAHARKLFGEGRGTVTVARLVSIHRSTASAWRKEYNEGRL